MFFKFEILSDIPGRLRLKVSNFKKIPKEAINYQQYGVEVIKKLEGIKSVRFNFITGSILIEYDKDKLNTAKIMDFLNGIRDLISDNMTLINNLDSKSEEEIEEILFKVLDNHLKEKYS